MSELTIKMQSPEQKKLTVKVLVRMHARILRCRPTSRIHPRRNLRRIILPPPLHQQRNRILRTRHTPHRRRNTLRRRRRHPYRLVLRDHALANVDMVRVEVVRDVGVATRPRLERLQLALGLAHVAVEVVEVAECGGLGAGVRVCRVEAFVVLDEDEDPVFAGCVDEGEVVYQALGGGFGDEDVVSAFDGVERDGVVG